MTKQVMGGFWLGYGMHAAFNGDWNIAAVFLPLGALTVIWDIATRGGDGWP